MTKFYIGTSGWSYGHWRGVFYPEKLSKNKWFDFYSQHFDTVEINNTFYRWPNKGLGKKWLKNSPENFKFTLKAPRLITHMHKLRNIELLVRDFYDFTEELKNKNKCILFQLHPRFKNSTENISVLNKFLKSLDKKKINVIEFRNSEWWKEEIYELLTKNKAVFCSVSGLHMPEEIIKSGQTIYLRLHGEGYSSLYNSEHLKKIAKKILTLDPGIVFIYFNNDVAGYAIKNALEMKKIIGDLIG